MPRLHGFEEPGLVHHDLEALGRDVVELRRRRQIHGRGGSAGSGLEGLVQRPHELPAVEAASRRGARTGRQVGSEEGIGQLSSFDGRRGDLSLGDRRRDRGDLHRCRVGDDELFRGEVGAGFEQPVAAHALRHRRCRLVGLQQLDERGVARSRLGEDRGDAVEPLQQLGASRITDLGIRLHTRALFAHQEGDHLELHPIRGAELPSLRLGLDLAHLAREDRDEGCLVVTTGRLLAPRGGGCRSRHAPPEREGSGFPRKPWAVLVVRVWREPGPYEQWIFFPSGIARFAKFGGSRCPFYVIVPAWTRSPTPSRPFEPPNGSRATTSVRGPVRHRSRRHPSAPSACRCPRRPPCPAVCRRTRP